MSERYNVAASAVLGENYKITNIECSDYNPAIDGTITVTISVNDVYGDAISGESVTVTASEGNFTQLNGSDITSASSVTGTTNSSGQFTLTYIDISANNAFKQVNVIGFKSKNMWNGTLYYDNEKVEYWLNYAPSTTLQVHNSWTDSGAFDVVPEELRPKMFVFSTLGDTRMVVRVHPDTGKLQYVNSAQMTDPVYKCILTWFLP